MSSIADRIIIQFKIEELTTFLREHLPHLKQIRRGCLIRCKDGFLYEVDNKDDVSGDVHGIRFNHLSKLHRIEVHIDDIEDVVGSEVMLNDILHYFRKDEPKSDVESRNQFETSLIILGAWDMTQPYLKDQNDRVIEEVYELIINNNEYVKNDNRNTKRGGFNK